MKQFRIAVALVVITLVLAACGSRTANPEFAQLSESPFDFSSVVEAVAEGASGEVMPGVTVKFEGKVEPADERAFKGEFVTPKGEVPEEKEDPKGTQELENLDFTLFAVEDSTRFSVQVEADLVREMLEYDERSGAAAGTEAGGEEGEGKRGLDLQHVGDDRTVRTPTTARPWRAVGRVSSGCTGTLVGPSVMVTAAHCLVSNGTFTFADFAPAQDGSSRPYGEANITSITVPSVFVNNRCSRANWTWTCIRNDFAVVILDNDYNFNMGYWYMAWNSGLNNKAIYNRGYAGCGSADAPPSCQWSRLYGAPGSGRFTSLSHIGSDGWSDVARHNLYTNPGHSGSPAYMYVDGHAVVTGIHSSGSRNVRGGSAKRLGPSDTGLITTTRNIAASR